jgi:UrcA family protein
MSKATILIRLLNWKTTLGLAALGAFGTAAIAQEPSAPSTVADTIKVSLTGLDLETTDGVRAAHERVRTAARRVCAKVAMSADMSTRLNYLTCIDEAMANSLAQIDELAHKTSAQRLAHNKGNE